MIDLHFTPTPNGQKISIALEELELPYTLINYDIFEGDQHTAAFGRINPNHKLPAIVDHAPPFGGAPHAVFESGAILQYLAEKTGRLLPADPRARSVAIQWLTWQVANMGPMGGQAAHFIRYAPEQIPYAITRYSNEVARLLTVLERRLDDAAYLADRIAMFEGGEQTFGTQFDWDENDQLSPAPTRDPAKLDDRRASVGLPPMAETIAHMRANAAAEGERQPADLAQRRADFEGWARRVGWRA